MEELALASTSALVLTRNRAMRRVRTAAEPFDRLVPTLLHPKVKLPMALVNSAARGIEDVIA